MSDSGPGRTGITASANDDVTWQWLPFSDAYDRPDIFGQLIGYWDRKRGDRWAPSRADIDPADLVDLLPYLLMMDVIWPGPRYRYRLAGTGLTDIFGIELTGRYIDEMIPRAFGEQLTGQLNAMIENREPQFMRWSFVNSDRNRRDYRVLRLPLSTDGTSVDIILMTSDFAQLRAQIGGVSFTSC